MKSYKEWLTEGFITAVNSGNYYEIYENPSKSEVDSLGPDLRFVLDSVKKKLYVTSAGLLHDESIKAIKEAGFLEDFNYTKYWKEGKDIDRFLTFVREDGDYFTDSTTDLFYNNRGDKTENKKNINILLDKDFSWLERMRWFDYDKFNKMLKDIRSEINKA